MPRLALDSEDAVDRRRVLVTRNRVLLLGLLIGLGGTAFYLGYMWFLSPVTMPGVRFELSERDMWQRKAEDLPTITAPVGFFLAGAASVWRWMTRRTHLDRIAWPLLLVAGGFGVLFGWIYIDILTDTPCHEEDDDCGPANAFRYAYQAFYLLPIAAVLAAGLWRRHRPDGQRLLAAGSAAVVAVVTAYLAYWAASVWVPPVADDLRANECAVTFENNLSACVQTPGFGGDER
ncbi:hypothetical protein [Nocardioides sp. Soil805]|uniref:hypothetical protein n=1 Tax=Nocardioides sp. Soil805 TaxID=1736416 RepID=UPI00070306C9|nr:hypothetical protein [Nocardioides sp. Soil805]KRF34066.1 hypothetical protein ASG94_15095 [Nocardioides sp. Soil805]